MANDQSYNNDDEVCYCPHCNMEYDTEDMVEDLDGTWWCQDCYDEIDEVEEEEEDLQPQINVVPYNPLAHNLVIFGQPYWGELISENQRRFQVYTRGAQGGRGVYVGIFDGSNRQWV